MPFTSKWQYLATVDYTLPTGGSIHPFVGATLSGRTSTTSIVGSAQGAPMLAGFRSLAPLAATYDLPGYTMLDLRAGVESADGDWRFTVWGRNITNEFSVSNVQQSFESIARYAGPPATYGVTFSHKFRPKEAGSLVVMVRAFNTRGDTQVSKLLHNPAGYHHNVIPRIRVEVLA